MGGNARPRGTARKTFARTPVGRIAVGATIGKALAESGWEKIQTWECLCLHREKGLFLSVYVGDIIREARKTFWSA